MFGHPTKSILTTVSQPKADVLKQKAHRNSEVQQQYNQPARDLSQLVTGSPVLVNDFQSLKNQWIHGQVVDHLFNRSYLDSNDQTQLAERKE